MALSRVSHQPRPEESGQKEGKMTTINSPRYEIMGYEYRCGKIDARTPDFLAESEVEFSQKEKRSPVIIHGWRQLVCDIKCGDSAVGDKRPVSVARAKKSLQRLY